MSLLNFTSSKNLIVLIIIKIELWTYKDKFPVPGYECNQLGYINDLVINKKYLIHAFDKIIYIICQIAIDEIQS